MSRPKTKHYPPPMKQFPLPDVVKVFVFDQNHPSSSLYDASDLCWVLQEKGWSTPSIGATVASVPHVGTYPEMEQRLVTSLVQLAHNTFRCQPLPTSISGSAEGFHNTVRQQCVWAITSEDDFWKYPGREGTVRSRYMPANSALVFPCLPEENGILSFKPDRDAEKNTFGLLLITLPWLVVKARKGQAAGTINLNFSE